MCMHSVILRSTLPRRVLRGVVFPCLLTLTLHTCARTHALNVAGGRAAVYEEGPGEHRDLPPEPSGGARAHCLVVWCRISNFIFSAQMIEKRETERRQLDEKKRKEEIEFLKHQGKHLDLFLKQMGAGK